MTSIHRKLVLALMLLVSMVSCKTVKTIPVETVKTSVRHDTLIMNHQLYDSIYVFDGIVPNDSATLARFLPKQSALLKYSSPSGGGKEGALGMHIEYRYKLLRDTIYKNGMELQRDSIQASPRPSPKGRENIISSVVKGLAAVGAISMLLILYYVFRKLKK